MNLYVTLLYSNQIMQMCGCIKQSGVYFNNATRRIFGYRKFESIKNILREFGIQQINLYITWCQ